MIAKANQRAGGRQLATHLLNAYDNERVEIAEVRGAAAPDLHGAFQEWRAISKATQCRKYLYSMSLNPDPRQGPLTRDQYLDFITRTEKKLGLENQPRAVVFHAKAGREHCHVVWSRIDPEKLKAVQISHDRQKLRHIARDFARDHGLTLPDGLAKDRGAQRFKDRAKRENLAEKQQQERTGIPKAQRRREITQAWQRTDSGKAFVAALEEKGYFLARGEKRAHVVIDLYGEVHSLTRQIEGATAKDVRARLKDFPPQKLPDAKDARQFAAAKLADRLKPVRESFREIGDRRRRELAAAHTRRRDALSPQRQEMRRRQQIELDDLRRAQEDADRAIREQRDRNKAQGLAAFLGKISGFEYVTGVFHRRQDARRREDQRQQREALERRHQRELHEFQRLERSLRRVEVRERRSLETALRREQFAAIARAPEQRREQVRQQLTPDQRASLERFLQNARDITEPERQPAPRERSDMAREFDRAVSPEPERAPDISGDFTEAAGEGLPDALKEALKRRARQKQRDRDRKSDPGRGR